MELKDYFEGTKGTGVLATADDKGNVNAAIYARPHFPDPENKETVAFIMAEGLSHSNVQFNSSVSYLFIEDGPGYKGRRLTLTKVSEEIDPDKIAAVRRHSPTCDWHDEGPRYLVYFHVDGERPLV